MCIRKSCGPPGPCHRKLVVQPQRGPQAPFGFPGAESTNQTAVDTLVHNFLHRTGILARFRATHPYGAACYRPGGCADIIARAARQIDVRAFNPSLPAFPAPVRAVRHLAVLQPAGPRYLQW